MPELALEDNHIDVIMKAQKGLAIDDGVLARMAGVPLSELRACKSGIVNQATITALSEPLQLHAPSLITLALAAWRPTSVTIDGLLQVTTQFGAMSVNAYLVWDPATKEAAAFDSGADALPLLTAADQRGLTLREIFITHTHRDHVNDLERLSRGNTIRMNSCEREPVPGSQTFRCGALFSLGALTIETRQTWGHSMGGVTFVIHGLSRPVAIVGDALFAASMGGGAVSWQSALATNRSEIFSLPNDTIICPGHGPLSSVGEEKQHNPLFPEFK